MPSDYLHVQLGAGAPIDGGAQLFSRPALLFPIENREQTGEFQGMAALATHFAQPGSYDYLLHSYFKSFICLNISANISLQPNSFL